MHCQLHHGPVCSGVCVVDWRDCLFAVSRGKVLAEGFELVRKLPPGEILVPAWCVCVQRMRCGLLLGLLGGVTVHCVSGRLGMWNDRYVHFVLADVRQRVVCTAQDVRRGHILGRRSNELYHVPCWDLIHGRCNGMHAVCGRHLVRGGRRGVRSVLRGFVVQRDGADALCGWHLVCVWVDLVHGMLGGFVLQRDGANAVSVGHVLCDSSSEPMRTLPGRDVCWGRCDEMHGLFVRLLLRSGNPGLCAVCSGLVVHVDGADALCGRQLVGGGRRGVRFVSPRFVVLVVGADALCGRQLVGGWRRGVRSVLRGFVVQRDGADALCGWQLVCVWVDLVLGMLGGFVVHVDGADVVSVGHVLCCSSDRMCAV